MNQNIDENKIETKTLDINLLVYEILAIYENFVPWTLPPNCIYPTLKPSYFEIKFCTAWVWLDSGHLWSSIGPCYWIHPSHSSTSRYIKRLWIQLIVSLAVYPGCLGARQRCQCSLNGTVVSLVNVVSLTVYISEFWSFWWFMTIITWKSRPVVYLSRYSTSLSMTQ